MQFWKRSSRTYRVEIRIGDLETEVFARGKTCFHAAAYIKRKYELRFPKRDIEILSCRLENK